MFIYRFYQCIYPLLRSIDILLCTIWLSLLYPFGLADKPTGREMISSYVGKAEYNGHRWAKFVAPIINWGARMFGDKPDHCRNAYLNYIGLDD